MDSICCLCKQTFTSKNIPRIMPFCEHNSCTNCLKSFLSKKKIFTIKCGFCGEQQEIEQNDIEYFPKNIKISKVLKQSARKQLAQKNEAIQKSEKLQNSHQSSVDTQKSIGVCEIHHKEKQIVCVTDREKICPHCAIFGGHKDHKFKTIPEVHEEISEKDHLFNLYRHKKSLLDSKMTSSQFKQSIITKISNQKECLVNEVKSKFHQVYENLKLAEKAAYDDIIKNFKTIYHKITSLTKQQNDAQQKYKSWESKCQQLFVKAHQCELLEEKVSFYYDGPLTICTEGESHLQRIEKKIDSDIHLIENLITKIKIVEKEPVNNAIFNYLGVYVEDLEGIEEIMNIQHESINNSFRAEETVYQEISRKPVKVEFSTQNMLDIKRETNRTNRLFTPKKNSKSKEKQKNTLSEKRSPLKPTQKYDKNQQIQNKKNIQVIVSEFCERENLQSLDLSNYNLPDNDIVQILKYLNPIKKIKGLKLVKNKLSNEGLSSILDYIPFVTNLNLSFNQLSEDALNYIIMNRSKISCLRIMNLSNNKINERKAKSMVDELKRTGIIVTNIS